MPVTSPERRQADLDETARDGAKAREFSKDPVAWIHRSMLKKKD